MVRHNTADCELYAQVKRQLSLQGWANVQNYANAKQAVVGEIMARAKAWAAASVSGEE